MRSFTLPLLLAATLAGPAAHADGPRVSFGFGFNISQPMGDFNKDTDSQPGHGFGWYMPMDFGGGHVLRPKWEWTRHSLSTMADSVVRVENGKVYIPDSRRGTTVESHGLGFDYLYYFEGNSRKRGPYLIAGVGVDFWAREKNDHDKVTIMVGSQTVAQDFVVQKSSALTSQIGLGMQLSKGIAVEAKFRNSQYRLTDVGLRNSTEAYLTSRTRNAGAVQVGLNFKF